MTMFSGEYKERICAIKVLFSLYSADAISVTVCEKILACWMTPICQTFEERGCFANKIVTLLNGLFYLKKIAWGIGGNGEGF